MPGPDRRDPAQDHHRRDDLDERRRHHDLQRQGRLDRHERPDGGGQRRRPGGDLMPGPMLHVGAGITCTHSAPSSPVTANARVLVRGDAGAAADRHVPGGGLPVPGADRRRHQAATVREDPVDGAGGAGEGQRHRRC